MLRVFDADLIPITIAVTGAVLCLGAGFRELRAGARERVVGAWWAFALAMLTIATGHLWHVGGEVAESGREVFRLEGLYGSRRPFQAALVVALLALGLLVSPMALRWVRTNLGDRFLLPVVVLGGLAGFLAIRTISLHAIDAVLYGKHIFGGHPGSLLEALGLALFVAVAALAANTSPGGRRQAPASGESAGQGPGSARF